MCYSYDDDDEVMCACILLFSGVVFEQGSAEIQSAFAYALTTFTPLNISNIPRDKFAFNAYVDTINTADAFKLSKLSNFLLFSISLFGI